MMSGSNPIHAPLLFLLILLFSVSSFQLSFCIGNNTIFCPEIEKQSLLSFKQYFNDSNNQLSSWDGTLNCCEWKGVICDNLTGHVHQLHLRNAHNAYEFGAGLKGKINPSLLSLKYLRYLDLSGNALSEGTIPSFVGSLAKLEYLNLSRTGFYGQVPRSIGNLSNLHTLDLRPRNIYYNQLVIDSLEWMIGLPRLEYLRMNRVNLSKANNWAQVITSLPSLTELHFEFCSLDFMAPLENVNISTSLKHLYFLDSYFAMVPSDYLLPSVTIPRWIFQFTNLLSLHLSQVGLTGPFPTTSNATKLQHIDLSSNRFNSSIPDWFYLCKDLEFLDLRYNQLSGKIQKEISNLCKLRELYLSMNYFQGDISDSFGDMSGCQLKALEYLDLGFNNFSGHLTNQFGKFKSLQYIYLYNNSLNGVIPVNIGKLSSLIKLQLSGNNLTGTFPESLGQLSNLRFLSVDDNIMEGVVTEAHFAHLTKLEKFSASRNHLTLKVDPNWNPPFQINTLRLASWSFGAGSKIPSWLKKQKNIVELDLSNTGISGTIPRWLRKIQILDLTHNHLRGKIPNLLGHLYVYLGSNRFSGSLPRIARTMLSLDLSNNSLSGGISHLLHDNTYETYGLKILHLGGNQLSGELPTDCWIKWPSLRYLNLGNNNFSGSIPNSIGYLAKLLSLNLHGNMLSGKIPFSMHNCTDLVMIDVGDNDLDGGIPTWVGTHLVKLTFLILRSNKMSGDIPLEICRPNSLQILDLSNNKFSGKIPRCLFNFTVMSTKRSLYPLTYSTPHHPSLVESALVVTKGRSLLYGSTLYLVTSIDLSNNNLSGDIPKELTSLVELRSLNLSQNHLTGSIPDNIGDMKQLESLDFSINFLSGRIPYSFKLLSFLGHLNLSHNKFTGRIPESTQLRGFDNSSFSGNNLCGPPLTIMCSGDDDDGDEGHEEEGGDESKIEWFYVLVSLGYAVGFSAVCSALVLNKSWRVAYFGLLERMWDELYVYVHIKCKKLTKPSHPTS